MSKNPIISIVLPVIDDQNNLNRILAELASNPADNSWEVIVVDDGSKTPLQIPENSQESWHLFRNETRQGAAISRNRGAEIAIGEHLVFLSVFLKIPADYIQKMRQFINEHEFDFAQHLIVSEPEINTTHFQQYLTGHKDRLGSSSTSLHIKNCQFAAAVIKKETFSSVQGFDESMQHYGGHELDIVYRLDQAGQSKRILVEGLSLPRVSVENHRAIQSKLREYGKTGLPNLLSKHPELQRTIIVKPILWTIISVLGIPRILEKHYFEQIEADKPLSNYSYRIYLHLIVRNAWDAR